MAACSTYAHSELMLVNNKETKGSIMKLKALVVASLVLTVNLSYASSDDHHFPGISIGETGFTYGLEYEYKFSSLWGAGVFFEKTNDAHHGNGVDVSLASAYLHPWKALE